MSKENTKIDCAEIIENLKLINESIERKGEMIDEMIRMLERNTKEMEKIIYGREKR